MGHLNNHSLRAINGLSPTEDDSENIKLGMETVRIASLINQKDLEAKLLSRRCLDGIKPDKYAERMSSLYNDYKKEIKKLSEISYRIGASSAVFGDF